jgi:hypothetical protein
MRRTRMKKLALLLSLLTLGALGLVSCGGDDDEGTPAEATLSADTTETKPSRKQAQELKRVANDWASLFAVRFCNRYMSGRLCVRLDCARHLRRPIKNCTPVSRAFQRSFADATIDDIKSRGIVLVGSSNPPSSFVRPVHEAAVKFSNGVVVVFDEGRQGGEPPPCPALRRGRGETSEAALAAPRSCTWVIAPPLRNGRFIKAAAPRESETTVVNGNGGPQ